MHIQTAHFGEIEVADHNVITFTKGIPGFGEYKQYALFPADETGKTPFFFLQSIDKKEVNFLLLDTFSFFKAYDLTLEDHVVETLKIEQPEDAIVFTTVTVQGDFQTATTNLKAPLIINHTQQLGLQIVLQNDAYQIKQPLFDKSPKAEVGQV